MNASKTFQEAFLDLLFLNADIAGIGDAGGLLGSVSAGNLYVRLCTDVTEVDDETIGAECAYTGYVSGGVAIPRTSAGFERASNEISNKEAVEFGPCSAGTENIAYAELWLDNSSETEAGRIAWMEFAAPIAIAAGMTPRFAAGALTFTFD